MITDNSAKISCIYTPRVPNYVIRWERNKGDKFVLFRIKFDYCESCKIAFDTFKWHICSFSSSFSFTLQLQSSLSHKLLNLVTLALPLSWPKCIGTHRLVPGVSLTIVSRNLSQIVTLLLCYLATLLPCYLGVSYVPLPPSFVPSWDSCDPLKVSLNP